jgi:hypothetical protein
MTRIVLAMAEWQAIAHELAATHTAIAPPGLLERVQALLAQAPPGWPDQSFALELDEGCAAAVQTVHASLTNRDPAAGQRVASVAEAVRIIHDHQQRS